MRLVAVAPHTCRWRPKRAESMRYTGFLCLAAVLVLGACSSHTEPHEHYAVLPESMLGKMMQQCSRKTPNASSAWSPGDEPIQQLESLLPKLGQLAVRQGLSARIGEANASFRQYQGIVVDGHPLIYINALPFKEIRSPGLPALDEAPLIVCDGGDQFWGAIYDPQTRTFSQLLGNGQCCGVDAPPPPPPPPPPDIPPPPGAR